VNKFFSNKIFHYQCSNKQKIELSLGRFFGGFLSALPNGTRWVSMLFSGAWTRISTAQR